MKELHSLLVRQLRRARGQSGAIPAEWQSFVDLVDDAYEQSDIDRGMLERALDLSSQELIEANSEMRAIVQAFPDLFLRLDRKGRILDCKAGVGTNTFLPPARLVGKRIDEVLEFDIASKFWRAIDQVFDSRTTVSMEYSAASAERIDWYETRLLPLLDNQLLAIVRNITNRKAAETALRQSEREYRGLFETAHDAIMLLEPSTLQVLKVNERACIVYGYSSEEFVGSELSDLVGGSCMYREHASDGDEEHSFEAVHTRKDGTAMQMDIHTSIVQYEGQEAILSINRDVTAREESNKQLEASLSLLQATLDSTADGILVVDMEGQVVAFNRRFGEMWRIPEPILASGDDSKMLEFVVGQLANPKAFVDKVEELYSKPLAESHDLLEFKDERVFERYSRPQRVGDESVGRVWSFREVTQQRAAEADVRRLAYYDHLTRLPNRLLLNDRLEDALANARRNPRLLSLLFLDLDRFKTINDTLGHLSGDALLKQVAERLAEHCREGEALSRLGGDEFVLMVHQLQCPEDAAKVAVRMLKVLEKPFTVSGRALHVTGSIGISVYPMDGSNAETLMRKADTAMYAAKERGRGTYRFYDKGMDARALEQLTLENDLRHGLEGGEFAVWYQPQVDLVDREIVGVEALVRWRRKDGSSLLPGEFIPLAERSGLIVPLGDWVLRSTCLQGAMWSRRGLPEIRLSVNVSARQLERRDFFERIRTILSETGLDPGRLELELTESAILLDPERTAGVLAELRGIGVGIALDDFGTGHSSLSNLTRLPISTLKLDQCFVRSCADETGNGTIVTAILSMARGLGLRVVAEGVETAEELSFLRDHHCGEVQGFYFSPAVPPEEFFELAGKGIERALPRPA